MVFGRGLFGFSLWLLVVLFLPVFVLGFDYDGSGFSRPLASSLDSPVLAFEDSSSSGSLSVSGSDDLVYRYGFYSLGGGSWERFDLSGQGLHGVWFVGGADSSLGFSSDDFGLSPGGLASDNYVLVYTCSYLSSSQSWDCHGGRWQLSPFNATLAEEPAGCSSDAGCDDGNPCTSDSCDSGSCSNVALADGVSCPADGDSCTRDECVSGVCSHPPIAGCGDTSGCTSRTSSRCIGGDVYWFDSCDYMGGLRDECAWSETCLDGACVLDSDDGGDVIHVQNPGEGNDIGPDLVEAWERADAGDTVLLPAGSFTIGETAILYGSHSPDVHLRGRGDGPGGTRIYRDFNTMDYMIRITGGNTRVEISDIWFQGPEPRTSPSGPGAAYQYNRALDLLNIDFYLHDCTFQWFTHYIVRTKHGGPRGCVVSNNRFIENAALMDDGTWEAASCIAVTGLGHEWPDVSPGTDDFVYVEDNYFSEQTSPVVGGEEGRYVFRHNYVERNTFHGVLNMHSPLPAWKNPEYEYATRYIEVYGNTFIAIDDDDSLRGRDYDQGIVGSYGGEGVIWGNTIDGYDVGLTLQIAHYWWDEDTCAADPDCSSSWETPAYPVPYQHGWESGDRFGSGHSGTGLDTYGAGDWFIWDNAYVDMGGAEVVWVPSNDYPGVEGYIQEGRDYHVGVPRPGYSPYEYPHPVRG